LKLKNKINIVKMLLFGVIKNNTLTTLEKNTTTL